MTRISQKEKSTLFKKIRSAWRKKNREFALVRTMELRVSMQRKCSVCFVYSDSNRISARMMMMMNGYPKENFTHSLLESCSPPRADLKNFFLHCYQEESLGRRQASRRKGIDGIFRRDWKTNYRSSTIDRERRKYVNIPIILFFRRLSCRGERLNDAFSTSLLIN